MIKFDMSSVNAASRSTQLLSAAGVTVPSGLFARFTDVTPTK